MLRCFAFDRHLPPPFFKIKEMEDNLDAQHKCQMNEVRQLHMEKVQWEWEAQEKAEHEAREKAKCEAI